MQIAQYDVVHGLKCSYGHISLEVSFMYLKEKPFRNFILLASHKVFEDNISVN